MQLEEKIKGTILINASELNLLYYFILEVTNFVNYDQPMNNLNEHFYNLIKLH